MHRSRLSTILIDCADDDFERSLEFWSAALGKPPNDPAATDERYVSLRGRIGGDGGPIVLLQRVSPDERAVHLDIESDDVGAEVVRLEKLGARRIESVRDWWVMEAPSGHRFCVVPAQTPDFERSSNRWD